MPNTVIVGAQWGDEGKGKIIDVLTEEADVVARYQGGNNAGHTVEIGAEHYVLHLIPSGILHDDKICVIGNGVVVDPLALLGEMDALHARGIATKDKLLVGDRCHVVFPYHRLMDESREARLARGRKIGTTKRGIGPSYGDKASRQGLRACDLVDPAFPDLLAQRLEEVNSVLQAVGAEPVDPPRLTAAYAVAAERLAPYITDSVVYLNRAVASGKSVLFEGAQGTMLDIDFGTYPFVTSSNATAGGACTGTGVAPHRIDRVVGVVKAYTTRVGEGPFPTELDDETGKHIGRTGHEFGATTGRARRCGWFDAVVARYSAMINGIDMWAMTKLDVLDALETIRICVAYDCGGERLDRVPANVRRLVRCRPVYEEMPGWRASTRNARRMEDLPAAARAYVDRLCEITGVPLGLLSVGADRNSTLRAGL
ncbi:MAG: adenylosuccinate synthase [Lentisphaerae bacterium]|nr:adenylosuccinate synthase [Lentisphaerota bacterium]